MQKWAIRKIFSAKIDFSPICQSFIPWKLPAIRYQAFPIFDYTFATMHAQQQRERRGDKAISYTKMYTGERWS